MKKFYYIDVCKSHSVLDRSTHFVYNDGYIDKITHAHATGQITARHYAHSEFWYVLYQFQRVRDNSDI